MDIIVLDVSRYSYAIRNWWTYVVRAVMFVIVGILIMTRTTETYLGLAALFGAMVIISGILEVFVGSGTPMQAGRGRSIATGVIEMLLGVLIWIIPGAFIFYLPFLLGFWLLFRGYTLISATSDMIGYDVKGSGLTLGLAIIVVMLALLVLANPFFTIGNVHIWLGCTLIVAGIAEGTYALHLNRLKKFLTA